jgi:hypothetical protein
VVGNFYTVRAGLKPGEKLITAGIQKVRDGAPVQEAAGKSGAAELKLRPTTNHG